MRLALLCLSVAGCNQLYGIDETELAPGVGEPPDVDEDGVPDAEDLCPGAADPDQDDRDKDRFGDVCDLCPDLATLVNHDEDRDGHGDACDLCPARPSFQTDAEKDGIGDACDNDSANQNRLVLFDPFLDIATHWQSTGTWSALGDAITSEAGATLDAPGIALLGGRSHEILVGVTVPSPLMSGARFAVELVDDSGAVVVGCEVVCTTNCILREPVTTSQGSIENAPNVELFLRRTNMDLQACGFGTGLVDNPPPEPPDFSRAHVRLRGSPQVQFRYISVVQ